MTQEEKNKWAKVLTAAGTGGAVGAAGGTAIGGPAGFLIGGAGGAITAGGAQAYNEFVTPEQRQLNQRNFEEFFDPSKKVAREQEEYADKFASENLSNAEAANALLNGQLDVSELTPEQYKYVGDFAPQLLKGTAFSDIKEDQRYKSAQDAALNDLMQISQRGVTAAGEARMNAVAQQTAQQEAAQAAAARANLARRGLSGGGQEIASTMQANQAAADTRANEALNTKKFLEEQALQGLQLGSNLATNVRGQEYGIKRDLAGAQDEVSRFNTQTSNQAQLRNIDTRQNLSNMNTEQSNKYQLYNRDLKNTGIQYGNQVNQQKYGNLQAARMQGHQDKMGAYDRKYGGSEKEKDRNYQLASSGLQVFGNLIPRI